MEEINHGVLHGWRDSDYIGGTLPHVSRNPSGDWTSYLPPGEWQRNNFFDTYGCVSFSGLNIIEMQHKFLTGTERNFSDRFTVVMSGTIPNQGNWLWKVGDSIRKDGLVNESDCPAPPNYSQSTYYAPITIDTINKAKSFLDTWDVKYEYLTDISPDSLRHELQHCPLWFVTQTHAMAMYKPDQIYKVFDSYEPFLKDRLEAPLTAWKLVLNPRNMYDLRRAIGQKDTYTVVDGMKSLIYNYDGLKSAYGMTALVKEVPQAELSAIPNSGTALMGVKEE